MTASKIELTPKQSNIYCWGWQKEARFRDAICGRRFGKTYLAAKEMRRAIKLAVKWKVSPEDEIWYAAPTFKQAKRVFWRRLKRAVPRHWIEGKPNESECYIVLKTGHIVRIVGLDAYDNLRGSGLFFVIVDEWADCAYEAWEEVLRPMLSTCKFIVDGIVRRGGHALRIGTPKGFNHAYDTFVKGQSPHESDHRSWKYSTLEGGNVPDEEIITARRDMDARTFRQEYEASFENYSRRVYYGFSRTESVKICPHNKEFPLHIGMDFNINPMSATIFQEQSNGEIWQIDEIVIPTSNTGEMAKEIIERYGLPSFDPLKPKLDHITIYPDPAGAQRRTSAQGKTDIVKGGGNAIKVSPEGDAKLLEINGTASAAVIEYVRALREMALESAHGNRANADKLSAAQSGRAMELMNQSLIWLADKLRISYGEGALLDILRMIVKATQVYKINVNGKPIEKISPDENIGLRWSPWYSSTYADKQTQAMTLAMLRDKQLMSQETAIKTIAADYDIADPAVELALVQAEPPLIDDVKPSGLPFSQSDD